MGKILLIILSFISFSFGSLINFPSSTCATGFSTYQVGISGWQVSKSEAACYKAMAAETNPIFLNMCSSKAYYYSYTYFKYNGCIQPGADMSISPYPSLDGICTPGIDGTITCTKNPQNTDSPTCDDIFEKNGIAYTCDPNTNEATEIPNSTGLVPDGDGGYDPNCDEGYTTGNHRVVQIPLSDDYIVHDSYGCYADDITNPDSGDIDTGDTGTGGTGGDTDTGTGGTGGDTDTGTGGTGGDTGGDTGGTGGDTDTGTGGTGGDTGTGGGSGGGSSGGGSTPDTDTGGEGGDTGSPDIVPPDVATSCSDSNMTLQEKMLCELNQGMKNQNSESNPSDSLNNLQKDLIANQMKDNTAINLNIKKGNENTANANTKLASINNGITGLKTINQQIVINGNKTNESLDKIFNNDVYNDTLESDKITTITDDESNLFDSAKTAYNNVSSGFITIKDNYSSLTTFLNDKKSLNATLDLTASNNLAQKTLNVFGTTITTNCFFNQDLYSLFSPIRPFITFLINVLFVILSLKLFMRYALTIRGVA